MAEDFHMDRRLFLKTAGVFVAAGGLLPRAASAGTATITLALPPLDYSPSALEPYISARTLEFHHGKHHKAYVEKTKKLIAGTDFADLPLVEIIKRSQGDPRYTAIFNNAAQVYNHSFYWKSMKPGGGGEPQGKLRSLILQNFGTVDRLRRELAAAAKSRFGSGWAWLVKDGDLLTVTSTQNADTPVAHGKTPLLALDVWEHAYYLDYQNRRGDYVDAWLSRLVNWDWAERVV